jgi:hypothetical protein
VLSCSPVPLLESSNPGKGILLGGGMDSDSAGAVYENEGADNAYRTYVNVIDNQFSPHRAPVERALETGDLDDIALRHRWTCDARKRRGEPAFVAFVRRGIGVVGQVEPAALCPLHPR